MKKLSIAMLSMVLAGSMLLTGCGGDKTPAQDGADASADTATEYKLASEGKLTMATNAYFDPWEYYEGENIVGIDPEVAQAIADKLGLELVITDMDFDSIITAVAAGKADMGMAGMTVTEERKLNADFSQTYASAIQAIVVPEGSAIKTADDMAGKKIGVMQGFTGDLECTKQFGEESVVRFNKSAEAVMALTQGKIDCVVIDNEPAKKIVAANEGLSILDSKYTQEDYAIAFAKDNTALRDAVDKALGELIEDGTVEKIMNKYITAD
ncbi:ABC transporter substrate-binding protein [Agathobaculum desmolans]|uniref:ABC transporter substrate-binding protein n=1 Tax=Agathobaculum desmolans TaxID=39484 RepID=UPI00248F151C|nr:ABC transporter substrate-binding protein [Agathobaculum desmolans]